MALVTISELSIRFRGPALLENVSCVIERGQHIGLLGRNGAGKSTFQRILAGEIEPDHGQITKGPDVRVASLPQSVPENLQGTVEAVVSHGFGGQDEDAWSQQHRMERLLTDMELDPQRDVSEMSAGWKRRVLLAQALVQQPDLLLLDEPTNHLDINSIRWLEQYLKKYSRAFMFVTHDRQFLRSLATRILEIEGGKLFDWVCDYDTFLKRKEQELAAQEKQQQLFDKKLAQEEAWIRQGIKARRTRNEGRVRALKQLREVRAERRDKVGQANLQIDEGQRSGNLVAKVDAISFQYQSESDPPKGGSTNPPDGYRFIVEGFSTVLMRGDKVGLLGPNGVGKSTLLKLLLGELEPTSGSVRHGSNLQIAYFDQLRAQLDEDRTVEDDVADGYQTVKVGGSDRHVLGYLQDFLFTPERARTKIRFLSGGERNRVLLAKLFAKPANVIVLDEPTNDLDSETLEMLEARLVEFTGTLLVVSHDREFLNNVVASTIVFEPELNEAGEVVPDRYALREYVGGYDEWLTQFRQRQQTLAASIQPKAEVNTGTAVAKPAKKQKLSFKESKELEALPDEIAALEEGIAAIHTQMAEPEFYQQGGEVIAAKQAELADLESTLEQKYHRWEELEAF